MAELTDSLFIISISTSASSADSLSKIAAAIKIFFGLNILSPVNFKRQTRPNTANAAIMISNTAPISIHTSIERPLYYIVCRLGADG